MSTRRALLAAAATILVAGADGTPSFAPHPDAMLLAVCVHLTEMQAERQRLYDTTSDNENLTTPADHACRLIMTTCGPAQLASLTIARRWMSRPSC